MLRGVAVTESLTALLTRFRPAFWLSLAMVASTWGVLRLAMNRPYGPANWQMLVEFRAPLPFGHRVLIPLVVRPFVDAGVPVAVAFTTTEAVAAAALILVLRRAFSRDLGERPATLGAFAVLLVLAPAMLLQHRWSVYYPWDTWAMVALVAATALVRRRSFALATAVVAIAALNRESIALLPLLVPALHLESEDRRSSVAWSVIMAITYLAVRAMLAGFLPARGEPLHLFVDAELRLVHNLRWLSDVRNQIQWWGSLALLPLAWWAVRRHVVRDIRRMHIPIVVATAGLLVVANAYEPRVYGEVLVLGFWAVWVGAWRWARGEPAIAPAAGCAGWVDRYGAVVVVAVFALAAVWFAAIQP